MSDMLTAADQAPTAPVRLTSMAHGGGCGCKLAPSVLSELLKGNQGSTGFENLLVGNETGDDAAVWALGDDQCVISTTDFFTPIVDDPRDFGRIAATNAISDVYAMGGKPVMALALLGMPLGKISIDTVREILAGGQEACAAAGIPVAGGHSIDSPEPIYGLAVTGVCKRDRVRRNMDGKAGDVLFLTKRIGIGVYSAAFKKEALSNADYAEMVDSTTKLNSAGEALSADPHVHAMTDVTGFGLLGHALEIARGSGVSLSINMSAVPLLSRARELVRCGFVTGASKRNWSSYGDRVSLPKDFRSDDLNLLSDPQTSGGLLVSCSADHAASVADQLRKAGCLVVAEIGRLENGPPGVVVR